MTEGKILTLALVLLSTILLVATSVFTVKENEQVMVLRFGNPKDQITEPGLHFKLSALDQTLTFEKRILNVDPPSEEVLLVDQKRLVVDSFARYKIVGMLDFFKNLGTEATAQQRLYNIINSALKSEMGKSTLQDILSTKRDTLMENVQATVNAEAKRFGIEVVDVRIVRADLPEQVTQATFDRMKSEREREAREARAEGEQLAIEIRSKADKDRTVLISEAKKESEILRGQGDQAAIEIYGKAFSQDAKFYAFYRSLEGYRKSLADPETTLLISPNSDFLKYFKSGMKTE
ncbi:MAG: protease modulator HflC [Pseudobdellovibrionaceae bacterium]